MAASPSRRSRDGDAQRLRPIFSDTDAGTTPVVVDFDQAHHEAVVGLVRVEGVGGAVDVYREQDRVDNVDDESHDRSSIEVGVERHGRDDRSVEQAREIY